MEISGEVITELADALDERVRKLARIARHNVDYGLSLTSATVLARLTRPGRSASPTSPRSSSSRSRP